MKRVFGLLVVVFALAVGTGSAMATTPPPSGNSSDQSATLGQSSASSATAANAGGNSDTSAVAVSANNAAISQFAGQASDDGTNSSTQSANVQQAAGAEAVAVNTGWHADTDAVAIAANNAFVDQDAWQLALWGTSNTSSQSVEGGQLAGAAAVAGNTAKCADTDAFAGSFNNGWVNQLAIQLAFP